jgi:predicted RNA-binding Zn ribbon-like protein
LITLNKSQFEFTGGNLSLDFANTVDNRGTDEPRELLADYADLVRWAQQAQVIRDRDANRLYALAKETPGHAQTAWRSAVQLRESVYSIFAAVAGRRNPSGNALTVLSHAVQEAGAHARLQQVQRNFRWEWISPDAHLESVLWPVARSAAELLTSDELSQVRVCASRTCAWLFVDHTKNHRRRWCDMRTCGNRDKARRYYDRKRRS